MKYRFLSPAALELTTTIDYYEHESPGLGLDFIGEFEAALKRILQYPRAWRLISEHHRMGRLARFPYGIIYSIEDHEVLIVSVMHLRRHPDSWKKNLG